MKHVDKNEKMKFCQFPQCFVFEIIDLLFFFRDYLMPGTKVGVILPCCHPFIYCSRIDYQCTHISPKSLTPSHLSFGGKICYIGIYIYTLVYVLWRFVVLRQSACINSIGCLSQHDLISSVMVTGLVRVFWQSVRN